MPEETQVQRLPWYQRLWQKVRAVWACIVESKPLSHRKFEVAKRIVPAIAGSLAAVATWAVLIVGAYYGTSTLIAVFSIVVFLLYLYARRITIEPVVQA